MSYIGSVGERIKVQAKLVHIGEYATHFTFYGESHSVYKFVTENGNIVVWDTTSVLNFKNSESIAFIGSVIEIIGTVKKHSVYNEQEQTVIQRPSFKLIQLGLSPEEVEKKRQAEIEAKQNEQLASLKGEDFIWTMTYKRFKEHYSDCETLFKSYQEHRDRYGNCIKPATIDVIIREGRLVNSGVRGKHFYTFVIESESGNRQGYYAVSLENAIKRATKDFPEETNWKLDHMIR